MRGPAHRWFVAAGLLMALQVPVGQVHAETGVNAWEPIARTEPGLAKDIAAPADGVIYRLELASEGPDSKHQIHRSDDGGRNWVRVFNHFAYANRMDCVDATHCWVVGMWGNQDWQGGLVWRTANGGERWDLVRVDTPPGFDGTLEFTEIDMAADGRRGMAIANDELVYGTSDAGKTWTQITPPITKRARFWDVAVFPPENAVLVGGTSDRPLELWTEDGGATWRVATFTGEEAALSKVTVVSDAERGYVAWASAAFGGLVAHSADAGATWQTQRAGSGQFAFRDIAFSLDGTRGWAVGYGPEFGRVEVPVVVESTDGGVTWHDDEVPLLPTFCPGYGSGWYCSAWAVDASRGNVYVSGNSDPSPLIAALFTKPISDT